MIHEEICTHEVCKLAKEKGFPQHIGNDAYVVENEYDVEYEVGSCYPIQFIPDYLPTITAPTQSLLQRWLREEKKVHIEIYPVFPPPNIVKYGRWVVFDAIVKTIPIDYFDTYEQALENGLAYALKNLVI